MLKVSNKSTKNMGLCRNPWEILQNYQIMNLHLSTCQPQQKLPGHDEFPMEKISGKLPDFQPSQAAAAMQKGPGETHPAVGGFPEDGQVIKGQWAQMKNGWLGGETSTIS